MHSEFQNLENQLRDKMQMFVCDGQEGVSQITVADYALGAQAFDLVLLGGSFE